MPTTNITVGTNSLTLVSLPTEPGFRTVDFSFAEAVASYKSPFTGQTQTQRWPGADTLSGSFSLPPLTQWAADEWVAALMMLRGPVNVFQLGDPLKKIPRGRAGGVPLVDGAVTATSSTITTRGWIAGRFGVLLPGDYMQIGYRLYRVLDRINADATGKAAIPVFPTVREALTDATPIVLASPRGLFRLANNTNKWSADYTRLSAISIDFIEYR